MKCEKCNADMYKRVSKNAPSSAYLVYICSKCAHTQIIEPENNVVERKDKEI